MSLENKALSSEAKIQADCGCFLWYLYQSKDRITAICADCENDPEKVIEDAIPLARLEDAQQALDARWRYLTDTIAVLEGQMEQARKELLHKINFMEYEKIHGNLNEFDYRIFFKELLGVLEGKQEKRTLEDLDEEEGRRILEGL